MNDLSLDELLASAGPSEPRLREIVIEVAINLLESRIVVRTELWHRMSENDAFAMQFLNDALGEPACGGWDNQVLHGEPALAAFRDINWRAHTYAATKGAARYKSAVAEAQGGTFCSMCGRRDDLVVDHIEPVSIGGIDDAISNMQLLCVECNSGKSDLRDRALPIAVRQHKTAVVSSGLRFKHLLMDSVLIDNRNRGVCRCGAHADAAELRVTIWPTQAAANLLNLKTQCDNCD